MKPLDYMPRSIIRTIGNKTKSFSEIQRDIIREDNPKKKVSYAHLFLIIKWLAGEDLSKYAHKTAQFFIIQNPLIKYKRSSKSKRCNEVWLTDRGKQLLNHLIIMESDGFD